MSGYAQVEAVLGGVPGQTLEIPMTRELLRRLGECLVDSFIKESKKDFAKRGWSGRAQDGSAAIWDSFSYVVRDKTIEVVSTFPGIDVLVSRDIPPEKMVWLTQEGKERDPSKYPLTPREKKLGMKRGGRRSRGERLPLVIPLKDKHGRVIFRTAPLRTSDAWIHPGIARFTFAQRAVRLGRAACIEILKKETVKALVSSLGG